MPLQSFDLLQKFLLASVLHFLIFGEQHGVEAPGERVLYETLYIFGIFG